MLNWLLTVRSASPGVQRGKNTNLEHTEMRLVNCRGQAIPVYRPGVLQSLIWFVLLMSPPVPSDKGEDHKMNPQLQRNLGVPGKGSAKGTAEASAARAGWGHSTGYCPSKFQFPQNPARSMGSAVTSLAHSSQNTL